MDKNKHSGRIDQSLKTFPACLEHAHGRIIAGHRQGHKKQHRSPTSPDTERQKLGEHIIKISHIDDVENEMQDRIAKGRNTQCPAALDEPTQPWPWSN